ncbi:hypothetical protein ACFQ3S_09255 [Mucilaginibacter terrae]|uniref:hypothetical protein n=1 Tax=Mucilaginibacter terrae TaxID=1955052 RepID=UPI003640FB78
MTFIASVVAKKGVAIIADSLVTSQLPILHYNKFLTYLDSQPNNQQGEKLINPEDILGLFNSEPAFTKDFEEKLFRLNRFTAITTTGMAYINGKSISDIIEILRLDPEINIDDIAIPIEKKLEQVKHFLNNLVREHIAQIGVMGYLAFIITYYEKHTHLTHIYRASILEASAETLNESNYNYVSINKEQDWVNVVCDGQNKISEKILYGIGREMYGIFDDFVNNILNKLPLPENFNINEFVKQLRDDDYFNNIFYGDIELLNLNNLSLQHAVDLASLLMRLEVDFQKYTKNIPTVGGVIKLAVIDENGFRFLSGDKVEVPKHINY